MVWGTPKFHQRREVPIPGFLVDELTDHVKARDRDELIFGGLRNRAPLRVATFRTAFSAAKAIGVPDLHTAASLAIASGADVKVVQ